MLSTLPRPGHPGPRPLEGTQDYVNLMFFQGPGMTDAWTKVDGGWRYVVSRGQWRPN